MKFDQKARATQNFIKDKITGRVDILWRIFEKIAKKKLKIKSQERKNVVFCKLLLNCANLGPVTSILIFFAIFILIGSFKAS